ncbi:MAG: hypothetical protein OXH76_20885 [Boseongicola sp.]|nr:hypothetical protein [Boseongicola sp.]
MNSNLKLLPAALLVAMLALAGCGGGSGSDNTTMESTEAEKAAMQLEQDAMKAVDAAIMAVGMLGDSPDETAVSNAEMLIADANKAIDALPAADQMAHDKKLAPYAEIVNARRDVLTANAKTTKAEGERDEANDNLDQAYDDGVMSGKTEEGERRDGEASMEARQNAAEKFHKLLSATGGTAVVAPSNLRIAAYSTQIDAATKGVYDKDSVQVMIRNTKGDPTESEYHTGTSRDVDHTTIIGHPDHVKGSGFATGTNELKDHDNGDELVGSYMGASGTYTCGSDDCTSRMTNDGIQLGGTAWTFVPNANSMYMIPDPVAAYAEYGWWLDERAATTTSRVGAWYADGAGAELASGLSVANSSGTASYEGSAIGVAAYHHSFGKDSNAGGAFTADAALTADFDDYMVSGSITNFDIGGHDPGWLVMLNESTISGNSGDVTGPTTTTWTIDGSAGTAYADNDGGGWTAQFYDIPTADAHQPTGVAGGFRARYDSDGYMVGAFGAEQ